MNETVKRELKRREKIKGEVELLLGFWSGVQSGLQSSVFFHTEQNRTEHR